MKKITVSIMLLAGISITAGAQNISTVAGTPSSYGSSGDGGPALSALLQNPSDVKFDGSGNMYISDPSAQVIRVVNTAGIINTFAGNGTLGYSGNGGAATAAQLSYPNGLAVDASGNVYIADNANAVVRVVNKSGIINIFAGNHTSGYTGDGGDATGAELGDPSGLAFDKSGNLYIADYQDDVVRKVSTTGIITTVAGNYSAGNGYTGDGFAATNAQMNYPEAVALDSKGNIYIADSHNNVVRMVNTAGIISTFAGTGTASYTGDGGPATAATLDEPTGIIVDAADNVFIADNQNDVIRKVSVYTGKISTVVGNGTGGYNGDGIPATSAELWQPYGLTIQGGLMYIADNSNSAVRKISAPLAVNEVENNTQMSVYPNPSNGMFNLSVRNYELGMKYNAEVYNMLGQTVYSNTFNIQNLSAGASQAGSTFNIDLSGLSNGIYMLKLIDQDGSSTVQKVEIAR